MADFPPALPPPLTQGFTQLEKTSVLRSPMGYGPAKTRRQTTAVTHDVWATLWLTTAEKDILVDFYETTLRNGALEFNYTNFLKDIPAVYKFKQPISWRPSGNGNWNAYMTLEILP